MVGPKRNSVFTDITAVAMLVFEIRGTAAMLANLTNPLAIELNLCKFIPLF